MYNYTYLCAYQILMIAILTKWLPFYKKNEFYFAAAAVRGRYRGGVLGYVRTAAVAKKFQLVDTFEQRTPTTPPETNWKLCLVCQEETTESLVCRDHNCRNSILIYSSSSRHTYQKSTPSHSGCLVHTQTACL